MPRDRNFGTSRRATGKYAEVMTEKAGGKFHPGRCGVRPARETEAPTEGGGKYEPRRCGGHKNLENAATFSKFLGRRTNFPPHPQFPNTQRRGR